MAKGKSWEKNDADEWVERLWDSGLTSTEFVLAQGLPISARSLRTHAARRRDEIYAEWKALRASAVRTPGQVANLSTDVSAQTSGVDQVATQAPSAPRGGGQVASSAAVVRRDAFDFSNL